MYKIMINCEFNDRRSRRKADDVRGFFTIKFETGSESEAKLNAVARTKTLMISKGYSLEEIEISKFSTEEIDVIDTDPESTDVENAFIYY